MAISKDLKRRLDAAYKESVKSGLSVGEITSVLYEEASPEIYGGLSSKATNELGDYISKLARKKWGGGSKSSGISSTKKVPISSGGNGNSGG